MHALERDLSSPVRLHAPNADEMHEQRIQAAYDEWMEYGRERLGLWAILYELMFGDFAQAQNGVSTGFMD